jgi:hypothetical protein
MCHWRDLDVIGMRHVASSSSKIRSNSGGIGIALLPYMKHFQPIVAGLSGLFALYPAPEAKACSPAEAPNGYVQSIAATAVRAQNPMSAIVCVRNEGSSCGPDVSYQGFTKVLSVIPKLDQVPSQGGNRYVSRLTEYTLKDAAGNVVERKAATTQGTTFLTLGSTVCIKTMQGPVDAGVPVDASAEADAGAESAEVCAPIEVTSLEISEEDRAAQNARLMNVCGRTEPLAPSAGGTGVPTKEEAEAEGGCAVGSTGSGLGAVFLLSLAALLRRKARRAVQS